MIETGPKTKVMLTKYFQLWQSETGHNAGVIPHLEVFERNRSRQQHQTGLQHQVHMTERHLARPSGKTPWKQLVLQAASGQTPRLHTNSHYKMQITTLELALSDKFASS